MTVSSPAGLTGKVFAYCERGLDPGLLAEPLNALSNVMFFVAALYGWRRWTARPAGERGRAELALVILVALIAIGSTLFHTFATRWAAVLDVAPIGLFMLSYLAFTVSRLLGARPIGVAIAIGLFLGLLVLARLVRCDGAPCYGGSLGYVPALLALLGLGGLLTSQGHAKGLPLLVAAAVFAVALTARTLDQPLCQRTVVAGYTLGTHALWHLLNGVLLMMLLKVAFDVGGSRRGGLLAPARHPV